MNEPKLDENLGYLFEVGFNIGMLAYIEQNKISNHFGNLYRQNLQQLSFSQMMKRLAEQEQVISQNNRKIIEKWCTFFIQKSFIAGLNFFSEYIKSTSWKERQLKHLEILYYQCCFSDNNSLKTYIKGEQGYKDVLTQLGDLAEDIDLNKYSRKGEFLHADTLMLLRCDKELRILCIDYSIFSIKSIRYLLDVDSVEVLRNILLSEISYLKTKSVFSNLGLDTKDTQLQLSKSLARYYKAFKRQDKESIKAIQAGSYAYSFSEFLKGRGFFSDKDSIIYNIVGYSDRGISAMTVNRNNYDILATCSHIYKKETEDQLIKEARPRQELFNLIRRKMMRSFTKGEDFVNKILDISEDGITPPIIHKEHIDDFINLIEPISKDLATKLQLEPNLDFRQAHAELIKKELDSDANYIFLTGNPGIGKTTAIADYLKSEKCLDEGFLLFYVSPRTQVNLDILEKFIDHSSIEKSLCDDRIFTINTNSILIDNYGGDCTVHYMSNRHHDNFIKQTVQFINQKNDSEYFKKLSKIFQRLTEEEFQHIKTRKKKVLETISEALHTIINRKISNNIIATVAVQSLKKISKSQDTLDYFKKIFMSVYNETEDKPIEKGMKALSGRIKHLFIMIDEITGDNSGVDFLNRVSQILKDYDLFNREHGFNVKIIVADASIVEADVITQHLSETSAEPNKIFFRKATAEPSPLSVKKFEFNKLPAVVINANSYPAKSLDITYKIFIESIKFDEKKYINKKSELINRVQSQIIKDINTILSNPSSGQIIVYIQNKARLADLIEQMKEEQGEFNDYLEIHASLSEAEKKQIFKDKDRVKIIFMTASASRGLSFPKTKHILVDIPHFEIEKNLMEVIQVIYRGRGYYKENGEKKTLDDQEKELIFYLSEQAVYYIDNPNSSLEDFAEKRKLSLQERLLSLLNILLILKASIMTRISGYGKIGSDKFIIIPIGGKSIFTAGQTFSSNMSSLIQQLKKQHYKDRYNDLLKEVYSKLEKLLSSDEIILRDTIYSAERNKRSYLDSQEFLNSNFLKILNNSFADLLDFHPLKTGYVSGSLLIVPLAGRVVEENYKMRLEQELKNFENGTLLHQLNEIYDNPNTPQNLCNAIYDAIELVQKLHEQPFKTQRLEQNSQYDDQYYVLPLFTFLSRESINEYFARDEEEPEDQRFRDILENYIRSIYPVGNVLPIGYKYNDFPFLIFRSYSLNEIRSKLFTDKYFLTSNDLNVLNLILYQDN